MMKIWPVITKSPKLILRILKGVLEPNFKLAKCIFFFSILNFHVLDITGARPFSATVN